jgi:phage shock protein PspC (stress-responsive transcriptional regulator)
MNKVININFQGRVIPIEEPAYEELKKYVESLRQHFAQEEGREEIINDIENRIAELFGEKMKTGTTEFITGEHVAAIIASIGRPEQFDEVVMDETPTPGHSSTNEAPPKGSGAEPRGSLYRDESDKMLGGVCSGLASYLRIDSTIVRLVFALLTLGGFGTGFLIYVVLWIVLPSKNLNEVQVTRKLYRNTDQKVLGGVCSGIASYFKIPVWIPRLVFVLPIAFGFSIFFPFTAPFSGTLFLIYLVLWIVVPKAVTVTEKMEMRGERVDLEAIKQKVQHELQGVKQTANRFAGEAGPGIKKTGSGLLRLIIGLFKVFFFMVMGVLALGLMAGLFALFVVGNALIPLQDFLVNSGSIQLYGWGTLLLFFAVPVIGLVVWLIRAITGARKSKVLSYTLITLWVAGWVFVVLFVRTISTEFRRSGVVADEVRISQPSTGKIKVGFNSPEGRYYPLDFDMLEIDSDDELGGLRISASGDSLLMTNIKLRLVKSSDDSFHVKTIRRARASSSMLAEQVAEKISYSVQQADSLLTLPLGFPIDKKTGFRNQQVVVELAVPVGKEVYVDGRADELDWYTVRGGERGLVIQLDDDGDEAYWRTGVWYIMKESGIQKKYPDQEVVEDRIQDLKKEIEGLKKENINLEKVELNIREGDTTVNVKIQI